MSNQVADDLLEGLTAPQREAVCHVDGPLLVIAGPGSGKTRVITRRVAYLNRVCGIAPWNILAITFTNKAALEMRERVGDLVPESIARRMTVQTFHALCARLLRRYAEHAGLPPGYSIYDTGDQKAAVKAVLEQLEINTKNFPPASMLATISNAKNALMTADEYTQVTNDFYGKTVAKVYKGYEQHLERNGAVDFDDLLLKTVQLLKRNPTLAADLRSQYRYVLIDEYQDTNRAQFMIASLLTSSEQQNIMATGDPDQSIYGWRGADIQNILEFESHYPAAKTVRLEQNYRSSKSILSAADALIANNTQRKHKNLFTENPEGDPVSVTKHRDERAEAEYVVQQLQKHRDLGHEWGKMAVFYRMNSLSRVMEDALRNAGVPYQIARGTAFYDRKEIKDVVAYLRVIANPADEVNFFRVINTPARGISKKTCEAITSYARSYHQSANQVVDDIAQVSALTSRAQNSVTAFAKTLQGWRQAAGLLEDGGRVDSLRQLAERVIEESGLKDYYNNDKSDPDGERMANLGEFLSFAQQFEEDLAADPSMLEAAGFAEDAELTLPIRLMAFLERIALVSDVDAVQDQSGAVTMMTLHAAKGLEYPVVAMVGFEDGLLPHERSSKTDEGIEEERRLAFVGITRAMKNLYITHAGYRTIFGQSAPTIPSRFLRELPQGSVSREDQSDHLAGFTDSDARGLGSGQRTRAGRDVSLYPDGCLVRHPRFGLGRVVSTSPMGAHTRCKVDFNSYGLKTLVLQYAGLERVED